MRIMLPPIKLKSTDHLRRLIVKRLAGMDMTAYRLARLAEEREICSYNKVYGWLAGRRPGIELSVAIELAGLVGIGFLVDVPVW